MSFSQIFYNLDEYKQTSFPNNYELAKKKILENISSDSYEFISGMKKNNYNEINSIARELKKFENVLFLGTGGSSLGGKTLVSISRNSYLQKLKPKIFFVENIDYGSIKDLINGIELEKTAIVVTSKSGETLETLGQYFYISNEMKKKKISLTNKVFVITENKNSCLKNIQEKEKYKFIEHNKFIGGRYSVFSVVGLLPASLSGLNINKICSGARSFLDVISKKSKKFDFFFFPIFVQNQLKKKGTNISVLMPYIECLENFTYWYRQLWSESIGKKNNGTTPVNALGTVDQHSQLQLYLDGPKDKFYSIIGKKSKKSKKPNHLIGLNIEPKVLQNKTLEDLLYAEMNATIKAIKNKGLPLRFIEIEDTNEKTIGSLMMFFCIETIFACYLIDVNPFDQPAVEEVKILTKSLLKNGKD